ncbi:MAG TPA: tetratricopeptide repeat protein, partial [Nannocystis sp.]
MFTLVAFPACHRNRSEAQEPESEECFGARCVEEAEAAMWYKDYEKAREPLTAVCERGDGFQCYRLAELWHYGRGGPVDMGKAAKYYEASCAGDYPEGCEKRAELAREGDGDPAVELEYAMKACEGGRPLACVRAGEQINTARGVERDEAKAIEMFQKGCRLGDTDGCNGAGDLLFAQKSIDAQTRGLAAYIAACTGHSGYGCLKAGIAFHEGIGTRRDIERARQHFARACEFLENDGCLIEKELAKAGGEPIVLQFTSEVDELASGGLQAYDFTCRMTEQGPSALDMVLSRVARHKDSLDGCMKNSGAAVAVAWEFDKNRVLEV